MRVLHLLNHATGVSEVLEQKRSRFMKCSETRTLQAVKTILVHYTFYLKACSTIISQLDSLADFQLLQRMPAWVHTAVVVSAYSWAFIVLIHTLHYAVYWANFYQCSFSNQFQPLGKVGLLLRNIDQQNNCAGFLDAASKEYQNWTGFVQTVMKNITKDENL